MGTLEHYYSRPLPDLLGDPSWPEVHLALLDALEAGAVRSARRGDDGQWRAEAWVKQAILVGFQRSSVVEVTGGAAPYFDKSAFPVRSFETQHRVRLVPGGSAVRRGAYVAPGVVVMPPAYVNVGAYIGQGTMIDSHALVGSCAQVGERVHLSAGAQLGGVLEPAGATPVVIEDDVFVGALAGVFEGVCVQSRAVLAPGVVLTSSTVIYDLVQERELRGCVPSGAVVVPGSRPARGPFAAAQGLQLGCVVIVKYRDRSTDAATALEAALR